MSRHSRRTFLKQLGAFAGLALAGRSAFSAPFSTDAEPFNFLVIGDSLVSGQGLKEKETFYYLTKNWLENDVFKNEREVNLKVKAHSGASITLRKFEAEALANAEIGEEDFFHREINLSFPSITAQADAAWKFYEDPHSVDLIMLSGGITDIRLSVILNPLKDNDELKRDIAKTCNEKMFGLLEKVSEQFPNALIAVVGYYPFISKYTPTSRIFNNLLELYNFPRSLKSLINNPLKRQLLKSYRRKMVRRSMIWAQDSTIELQKAVDRINAGLKRQRAVFIESPLTQENSIGAKKSMLYEVGKKGKAQDAMASERLKVCEKTLDELREATDLKLRTRVCELATIGHPDPNGARAYAEAIKNRLKPFFLI